MGFVRHILRFLAALLFSILGTSIACALPQTITDLAFPQAETAHFSQAEHIGFTARAPPTTVAIVAITGDVTVMHGGAFVTHGVETQWASLNFGADFLATNTALTTNVPTFGRKFNQLTSRGWDQTSIDNVVNSPVHTSTATNRATGSPATAYFDSSGNYVVRDNVTGDLVQISNRNDPN